MKSLVVCLMSLLVFVQTGAAQQSTVLGQVRLAGGLPVAEAQVVLFDLRDLRRGVVAQATTDADGLFALPLAALGGGFALPEGFVLGANYPNPFNPSTIIPYQLAATAQVRLEVFNTLGQRMAVLVDGEQGAGAYQAQWDATDAAGRAAAAGLYLYRLTVDEEQQTGRMVLVDGQAGVPMGGAGVEVRPMAGAADLVDGVYGLVVAGEGLVSYVDADFRVVAGMEPVAIEVEGLRDVRMKVVQSGVLGDADNNGQVDIADGLLVAMHSANSSISVPGNGDVNCDHRTDWMDAWLIVTYSINPSDPALPSGIGQVGGCAEEEVRVGGNTGATKMYWMSYSSDTHRRTIHRANLDGSEVEDLGIIGTNRNSSYSLVLDETGGKMYWIAWSDSSTIRRANLDGSEVEDLISESSQIDGNGFVLDLIGGKMYWVRRNEDNTATIRRADLDGAEVEDLISESYGRLYDLALDVVRGKMYWIRIHYEDNRQTWTIRRANLDGSEVEDFVFGLGQLDNLVLDVAGGKMYWIDSISDVRTIQRTDLHGTNYAEIIFISLDYFYELDVVGGKMYWIRRDQDGTHTIQTQSLGQSKVEDLVFGLGQLDNLVLDVVGGKMYWIDSAGGRYAIQRANLDGFNGRNLATGSDGLWDLTLYFP